MSTGEYITIGGILLTIVSAGLRNWYNTGIKLAEQDVKIQNLEKDQAAFDIIVGKIFDELKDIRECVGNKVDRK